MASDLRAIMSLEVPLIVLLGDRQMRTSEVLSLVPGAIVELTKAAEEELTLLVNNRPIGTGVAVKVGENFGIKITFIGELRERIAALGLKAAGGGGGDEVGALGGHGDLSETAAVAAAG